MKFCGWVPLPVMTWLSARPSAETWRLVWRRRRLTSVWSPTTVVWTSPWCALKPAEPPMALGRSVYGWPLTIFHFTFRKCFDTNHCLTFPLLPCMKSCRELGVVIPPCYYRYDAFVSTPFKFNTPSINNSRAVGAPSLLRIKCLSHLQHLQAN